MAQAQALAQDNTRNLIIRVKIDSSLTTSPLENNKSDTESSNTTLLVSVIVVLVLLVAGYFLYPDSNESTIPPQLEAPATVIKQTIKQSVAPPVTISTKIPAIEENKPLEIEVAPIAVTTEKPKATAVQDAKPLSKEKPAIAEIAVTKAPVAETPQVKVVAEKPVKPASVFSDNVKRAQFTTDIKKREPVDLVEGVYPAQSEGLKQLYFFTELVKLKGQTIRHQWFHEGKLMSEIKFKIGGNRWRVNSSKRLNPAAMGHWEVKVVNNKNEVLLTKTIEYQLP